MPTYYCQVPNGKLDDQQKLGLARSITRRHSEATGAPSYFVQVVIDSDEHKARFIGGEPATGHIWIRADIRAGRSQEQLQSLMVNVMTDVAAITGVSEDDIWIYLSNLEPDNMLEYGHVLPLPGKESEWFSSLPEALRDRLARIGVSEDNFTL
jgi:phenylpyruvate tautomerase PptA (4-oxalocrotonate tautomerase family)